MDFLLEALTDWLKEMLVGGIMSNLSGMFDSVNQQVADISVQVGPVSYTHLLSAIVEISDFPPDSYFVDIRHRAQKCSMIQVVHRWIIPIE